MALESPGDRKVFAHAAQLRRRHLSLFIAYLQELPLGSWVKATRQRARTPAEARAEAALQAAVSQLRDPEAVFAARESVLSVLERFDSLEGRLLTKGRTATRTLRPETERAALAVLVRHELSSEQFALLYSAFEPLVPAALLFGIGRDA